MELWCLNLSPPAVSTSNTRTDTVRPTLVSSSVSRTAKYWEIFLTLLMFYVSLLFRFQTSPIKHLLPRQEPKQPRKLMRTIRERNIKMTETGIRKISPL